MHLLPTGFLPLLFILSNVSRSNWKLLNTGSLLQALRSEWDSQIWST